MKSVSLFLLIIASASVYSIQIEHIESIQQGWAIIPDGDGKLHLAKLSDYDDETIGGPESIFVPETDVIFRLFTRRNPVNAQVIVLNDAESLANSNFVSSHPTRFIIHGWNNDGSSPVNTNIRTAYLNNYEFNVVTVDWGVGANTINYNAARNHVQIVGPLVSRFVDFLSRSGGASLDNMYIIGHSLGGHIAGLAGKFVTAGQLNTIIALDPALPLFSIDRPHERVAPTDAAYVEVLHTNAGLLGFDLPIGQASFYPNGGRTQPGCGADVVGNCAHSRAIEFFVESINSWFGFWSTRCENYDQILNNNCVNSGPSMRMGGEPSNHGLDANGVYFLTTNGNNPFAQGPL